MRRCGTCVLKAVQQTLKEFWLTQLIYEVAELRGTPGVAGIPGVNLKQISMLIKMFLTEPNVNVFL